MNETAMADIALFLKRLQWGLVALAAGWLIWLLAPILTPFVLALALAWLGDPLVDRIEDTGRSRMTGVVLVFVAMVLVIVALLLVLVPMIERQISTLIAAAPQAQRVIELENLDEEAVWPVLEQSFTWLADK